MKLPLVFIVNGQEIPIEANPHQPLHAVRQQALAQSRNTGRPPEEWELRDAAGKVIEDLSRPVESYGFAPGTRLFLNLKVGAGG